MASRSYLTFGDRAVDISYPRELADIIVPLLGLQPKRGGRTPGEGILVAYDSDEMLAVASSRIRADRFSFGDGLNTAMLEAHREVVSGFGSGTVVLHAASLRDPASGRALLIPGGSRSGKSTLAAWLINNGFDYLSDDVSGFSADGEVRGLYRPLALRQDVWDIVSKFPFASVSYDLSDGRRLVQAPKPDSSNAPGGLILVPKFEPGQTASLTRISAAQIATQLMAGNYSAVQLADHGLTTAIAFARRVRAVRLSYGSLDQLVSLPDVLRKLAGGELDEEEFAETVQSASATLAAVTPRPRIPAPTPKKGPVKLTIGMATFEDYDGVYFTIQALRMYHPQVLADTEFVVIDNNPTSSTAPELKHLERDIPNFRYVPYDEKGGTAASKGQIFAEAEGRYVLGLDCHVLLLPRAIERLLAYFDAHPDTKDLIQGPLLYDGMQSSASHWNPVWRGGMWGTWAEDPRAKNVDGEPFDIPMQGMGLFACRKDAWLGFNPEFRGFGGEEGYVQEKFRQAGRRSLCLPGLQWMHRFHRPAGVPYSNKWEDRVHNYIVGFRELGLPVGDVIRHFEEFLDPHTFSVVSGILEPEFGPLVQLKEPVPA